MIEVGYCHPLVPPEWIAAHGLQPHWLTLRSTSGASSIGTIRGVCPYAAAMADVARSVRALVATTTCDQMRYVAVLLQQDAAVPVFLMNIPSTWQTAAARQLYRDELRRLGRFLERLGGQPPSLARRAEVMRDPRWSPGFSLREPPKQPEGCTPARAVVQSCAVVRSPDRTTRATEGLPDVGIPETSGRNSGGVRRPAPNLVPLALIGGPLLEHDFALFDLIEQAGGRVVLDATEGGRRTWPASFDEHRIEEDPFEALADAYFDSYPDPFRRPNTELYDWLGRQIAAQHIRGLVFHRYLWCDLWHAELHRLKEWSPVPVLDLDAGQLDRSALARTQGRIEAFLEMFA